MCDVLAKRSPRRACLVGVQRHFFESKKCRGMGQKGAAQGMFGQPWSCCIKHSAQGVFGRRAWHVWSQACLVSQTGQQECLQREQNAEPRRAPIQPLPSRGGRRFRWQASCWQEHRSECWSVGASEDSICKAEGWHRVKSVDGITSERWHRSECWSVGASEDSIRKVDDGIV